MAVHHSQPTALDVADWFLRNKELCSGEPITHLKLQKLVYYAQAWSLALNQRQLFEEDLQAWAHGPVAPSVYRAFAGNGWDYLKPCPDREPVQFCEDDAAILQDVAEIYGAYTAKKLENMTHSELPWQKARGGISPEARSDAVIEKSVMQSYFKELFRNDGEQEGQKGEGCSRSSRDSRTRYQISLKEHSAFGGQRRQARRRQTLKVSRT